MTCDLVLAPTLLARKDAALFQSFRRSLPPRTTIERPYLEPLSDAVENEHGAEEETTNPENRKPGDCHCQQAAQNDAETNNRLQQGIEGFQNKGLAALIAIQHSSDAGFPPYKTAGHAIGTSIRDAHSLMPRSPGAKREFDRTHLN